jgi:predicted anti-sigma-YlaC factor YlaD
LLDGFGAVRVVALAQQRKRILSHQPVPRKNQTFPIVLISSSTPKENINRGHAAKFTLWPPPSSAKPTRASRSAHLPIQ